MVTRYGQADVPREVIGRRAGRRADRRSAPAADFAYRVTTQYSYCIFLCHFRNLGGRTCDKCSYAVKWENRLEFYSAKKISSFDPLSLRMLFQTCQLSQCTLRAITHIQIECWFQAIIRCFYTSNVLFTWLTRLVFFRTGWRNQLIVVQ